MKIPCFVILVLETLAVVRTRSYRRTVESLISTQLIIQADNGRLNLGSWIFGVHAEVGWRDSDYRHCLISWMDSLAGLGGCFAEVVMTPEHLASCSIIQAIIEGELEIVQSLITEREVSDLMRWVGEGMSDTYE